MTALKAYDVLELPLDHVIPDPDQPRKEFDQDALNDLAKSIKDHGIIQPVTVRPSAPLDPDQLELGDADEISALRPAIIIAGERRYRASKIAGRDTLPCLVRRDLSASDIAVLQVIENLQRENLTLSEYCNGVTKLVAEIGLDDAAERLGKSKTWVSRRNAVAEMPEPIRKLVSEGLVRDIELCHELVKIQKLNAREFSRSVGEFREPPCWRGTPPNRSTLRETVTRLECEAKVKAEQATLAAQKAEDPEVQAALDKQREAEKKRAAEKKRIPQLKEDVAAFEQELREQLADALSGDATQLEINISGPYLNEYWPENNPKSAKSGEYHARLNGPLPALEPVIRQLPDHATVNIDLPRKLTLEQLCAVSAVFDHKIKTQIHFGQNSGAKLQKLFKQIGETPCQPLPEAAAASGLNPDGDLAFAITWLRANVVPDPNARIPAIDLQNRYAAACQDAGRKPLPDQILPALILDQGAERGRSAAGKHYAGVVWREEAK